MIWDRLGIKDLRCVLGRHRYCKVSKIYPAKVDFGNEWLVLPYYLEECGRCGKHRLTESDYSFPPYKKGSLREKEELFVSLSTKRRFYLEI